MIIMHERHLLKAGLRLQQKLMSNESLPAWTAAFANAIQPRDFERYLRPNIT